LTKQCINITPLEITPLDITPLDITPLDVTPLDITPSHVLFNFVKSVTPTFWMCGNCALEATLATRNGGLELSYENSSLKKCLFFF
jgi:hypothetical protein